MLLVACAAVVLGCLLGLAATGARLVAPPGWERTTATLGGSETERTPGTSDATYHRRYTFTATDGHPYAVTIERETRGRAGSTLPVTYHPTIRKGWGPLIIRPGTCVDAARSRPTIGRSAAS